jgi:O-antigen ligase
LHSLTSRTGLVAFYGGFLAYLFAFMLQKGKWKLGVIILCFFALTPVISYQLIPSFKYRVDVTLWDVEYSSEEGADLNYQSVGLRFKTWACCVDVWKENPVLGVGFADMKEELFACYEAIDLQADRSKWLSSAHNQYLEQLLGGGIPALLLLLTLFLLPLWKSKWNNLDCLLIGFLALLAAGMLTESFLERQLGINLFLIMYFLLIKKNDS